MKIAFYQCSDPYVMSKKDEILAVAREAFDDVPDEAIESRLQKYPKIALAEDDVGVAGFMFPTPHTCGRHRMVGLRFLTVGNRCRNKKLSTLLTGYVLVRAYSQYLRLKLSFNGPRHMYVVARVCNPKAYYTLTTGNAGVSPEVGHSNPAALVKSRQEIYDWMKEEFGIPNYDPATGIVKDGAVGAGIVPRNTQVGGEDQEHWERYVPKGSEVMVLMPLNWKYFANNMVRVARLLKPRGLRKY